MYNANVVGTDVCEICRGEHTAGVPHDHAPRVEVFVCPGGCRCDCAAGGECGHDWSGPTTTWDRVESATCARCGLAAITHDLMVMP